MNSVHLPPSRQFNLRFQSFSVNAAPSSHCLVLHTHAGLPMGSRHVGTCSQGSPEGPSPAVMSPAHPQATGGQLRPGALLASQVVPPSGGRTPGHGGSDEVSRQRPLGAEAPGKKSTSGCGRNLEWTLAHWEAKFSEKRRCMCRAGLLWLSSETAHILANSLQ